MRRDLAQLKGLTLVLAAAAVGAVVLGAPVFGQQPVSALDATAIRAATERALAVAPRGFQALQSPLQAGVRVLAVDVARVSASTHRVTIDLSQRALTYDPSGDVERITDHVIAATAPLTAGVREVEYRFLVDGLALEGFAPRVVEAPRSRSREVGAPGRVMVSAGHGWYLDDLSGQWRLQRDYYWGIVEDFVNHDIVQYLQAELRAAGLDVRPARHPDRGAGSGASGRARWEESAKYYIRDLGAPSSVWDYGVDDYAKDINSRPFYANWIDSAVVVSIHNNGGGGTGTETWYDATNGHEVESRRLAEIVNNKVVAAIRARYDPNWPDRGLRTCNGCKGETRLAGRPAILVEAAFMDTKTPDNAALHSETFKQIVAQAVRDGLQEWGLRAVPPIDDFEAQARGDIISRAQQDARFAGVIEESFGSDAHWAAEWEMRWLEVTFAGGRRVRLWHMTGRQNRTDRYVGFWDPDTGVWTGWQRVA
jgi:N-acetylmuramoyl-L-alanine amidase